MRVSAVLNKLGVDTRRDTARRAAELGLVGADQGSAGTAVG
jgi:hypothetical protein